jgi:cell division protein FtsQ
VVSWRRSRGGADARSGERSTGSARADEAVHVTSGEPTPAHGEDVPGAVLDELRQAFTGTPPDGPERPDGGPLDSLDLLDQADEVDLTFDGTLDLTLDDLDLDLDPDELDELPLADVDDLPGFGAGPLRDDSLFTRSGADGPSDQAGPNVADGTAPWVLEVPGTFDGPGAPDVSGVSGVWDESDESGVRIVPKAPDPDPLGRLDALDRLGAAAPRATEPLGDGGRGAPHGQPESANAPRTTAPRTTAPRTTIVIGGDDSMPDAVYLDDDEIAASARGGTSGAPDHRGMIVIGDELEASGAFDAVAVPSRSMDPRVRARRIAVKRAKGRKRLLWVAGVGGVVVVIVAVLAVFSSGMFAVERVDVQGAPYTQARYGEQLQVVIDDLIGEPVLLVDTRAVEDELARLPWVERVFVRTDFPDHVLIDVRERQPLATFAGSDGRYRVIDRDGYVLDLLDGRPSNYMLITGVGPDLEAGSAAGAQYATAAQLVGALPPEIRSITVAATLDPTTGDLGLVLQVIPAGGSDPSAGEPIEVAARIGSFSGLDGKLARLLQIVRDGLDATERIDVSTDDVIG